MGITKLIASPISDKICWGTAINDGAHSMINRYRSNPSLHVKVPLGDKEERLDCLRIKRSDIDYIFNREDDITITELVIVLGVRKQDLGRSAEDQYLTTILVGSEEAIDLEHPSQSGKIVTDRAVDFCEPCPDKCFVNLNPIKIPDGNCP